MKKWLMWLLIPLVPKNTNRCHSGLRYSKNGKILYQKKCPFLVEKNCYQYCRLLHKNLNIQAEVKECKINTYKH